MKRFALPCLLAATAFAAAACVPAAVVADVNNLNLQGMKTAVDVEAWSADKTNQVLIDAVAGDALMLEGDITQLKIDLGNSQVPMKVAKAMKDAQTLADNLKAPKGADSAKLVAEVDAVRDEGRSAYGM